MTQQLRLDLGERWLRIVAHQTAHTDNDLSIYDEATRTLWLSDLLFMEHVPVIAGSASGWLEVLTQLKRTPAQRVVPGHGPIQADWPEATHDIERYLATLRDEARTWLARDGDLLQAQENVGYGERDRWELFDQYHKRNVTAVYTELEWEE